MICIPNKYPNRISRKINPLKISPKVYDGSTIFIGKKESAKPFSPTEYVTNITSIFADFSQAYLMVLLALGAQN